MIKRGSYNRLTLTLGWLSFAVWDEPWDGPAAMILLWVRGRSWVRIDFAWHIRRKSL